MTPTVIILIVVGAVIAWGGYRFLLSRPPKEEEYYHFACPSCRRRLRFRERQSGHKGQCPQCGNGLTFPPISQSID
jgi:transcription initiation factor IIE alpha subunit